MIIDHRKQTKEEFEKELFETFPKMFKHRKDKMQSCMFWGVETGSGWYNLIWDTVKYINNYSKWNKHIVPKDIEIVQIKNKFAQLRIYIERETNEISGMCSIVEELSSHICEECGERGEIDTSKGWYMTLCDKCRKKRK
jgi:hypothetical protein